MWFLNTQLIYSSKEYFGSSNTLNALVPFPKADKPNLIWPLHPLKSKISRSPSGLDMDDLDSVTQVLKREVHYPQKKYSTQKREEQEPQTTHWSITNMKFSCKIIHCKAFLSCVCGKNERVLCVFFFFNQSSILYTSSYTCQSQSPNSAHHHPLPTAVFPPLVSIRLFSTSMSQLLPCKMVHLYHLSRFHIHALIYDICFSLSDLLHSV